MEEKSTPKSQEQSEITEENSTGSKGTPVPDAQAGGITDKHDKNAGSGGFNQGSEQDPDLDRGAADQTKDPESASREVQNPKTPLGNA